jgi:endonuclease/exonuclease/phosphatase family metal-dependent hydrolase
MKRYLKLIIATLLPVFSCADAQEKPEVTPPPVEQTPTLKLKVLCYNIRFGELASLEELAVWIKEQNPDVVALQELDCRNNRPATPQQNGKDFVSELGFRTGMLSAYGKTIDYHGGYYGIGILSKYPLASVKRVLLPKGSPDREQRAVLVSHVEYAADRYFTFACTHLDTAQREEQVKKLNEVLKAEPYPVIVAGDFNATPTTADISTGMGDWEMANELSPTSPASDPRNRIDYIFCYPADKWESTEVKTYDVHLSDHLPISAVLNMSL